MPLSLQQIARALNGRISNGQVSCAGPGHSACDNSVSVKITDDGEDIIVNTFSPADDRMAVLNWAREKIGIYHKCNGNGRAGVDLAKMMQEAIASQSLIDRKAIAVYMYSDADGTVLYQKRRYDDPRHKFDCWQPNGKSWTKGLQGVDRRVLYRLADVLKGGTVFFCEGERDADNLAELGLCTTTIVGAGTWTRECIEALRDRDVVILRDNDDAGIKRAHEAAQHLHGVASRLRVCLLPDLPPKGDVTDWIEAGGTVDQLQHIIEGIPDWAPSDAAI